MKTRFVVPEEFWAHWAPLPVAREVLQRAGQAALDYQKRQFFYLVTGRVCEIWGQFPADEVAEMTWQYTCYVLGLCRDYYGDGPDVIGDLRQGLPGRVLGLMHPTRPYWIDECNPDWGDVLDEVFWLAVGQACEECRPWLLQRLRG